jgi:ubiquitin C-terminal hydrolase
MHFWRSSDILIVHLKRFGVDEYNTRSRLDTFVDVPLGDVNFSPYFASNSPFRDQDNRYRLYAVSNHTGG